MVVMLMTRFRNMVSPARDDGFSDEKQDQNKRISEQRSESMGASLA